MSIDLSGEYWSKRYKQDDAGWDAGAITEPLKKYIDGLKDKNIRILIPGAGNSHEAEYLYRKGFRNVFVCDLSTLPFENLKKRCPDFPSDHLILGDFFELPDGNFDLIIEQTFFCAIDPALRAKYFQKMSSMLLAGGILTGVLFDDVLNTAHPPFGGNKKEYLNYIPESFQVLHMERCYNSIAPRANRELFMELRRK